jgi:putative flippase GtrA
MSRTIVVTADDFGLARSTTISILRAVDMGAVSQVSVIANGSDVPYALSEWQKRKKLLSLAVHINLTEGKALSSPKNIPHLVDESGAFRHSPLSLLCATLFATFSLRKHLQQELKEEITAQLKTVQALAGSDVALSVNSHQHVHMIPMVFDMVSKLHDVWHFSSVRLCREPLFIPECPFVEYGITGLARSWSLNALSLVNMFFTQKNVLPVNDCVIGTLTSGKLTYVSVQRALAEVVRQYKERVEIITHPGEIVQEEIRDWKGDRAWHSSLWRERERELMQSTPFKKLLHSFVDGSFVYPSSSLLQAGRYLCAGGIVAATSVLVLYFFTDFVGLWYMGSAVCAAVVSVVLSFTLQKFWTFSKRGHKDTVRELMLFFGNAFLNFVTNIVLLYLLVEYADVWYVGAQVIALGVIAVLNFFTYRYVIFKKKHVVQHTV